MPGPTLRPHIAPKPIGALFFELKKFSRETASTEYPWATRFVMGLPLAPWQREFKWSGDQCKKFILSAWTGVHLGTYLVTDLNIRDGSADFTGLEHLPLSNMVLDGQQRLTALEMYLTDRLELEDVDGSPCKWSQVNAVQQRRFLNTVFDCGVMRLTDEQQLRALYDLHNFGGIAHLEEERALGGGLGDTFRVEIMATQHEPTGRARKP